MRTDRATSGITCGIVLTVLAGTGSSQAINLDIGVNGVAHPIPASSYGAASGQIGTWNGVAGSVAVSGPAALVDRGYPLPSSAPHR
jgi:hypothetical protein